MSRAGVTVDAGGGEARERRRARRLDRDAAHRQRIDHHGGAAGRSWSRRRRAARRARRARDRHAAQQRQPLDQAVERIDARDAAIGEERARRRRPRRRARRCARPQARAPPPSGRACRRATGLPRAAAASAKARSASALRMRFEEQHVAVDRRDHRASRRRSRRAKDRPRCRPRRGRRSRCRAPCRATAARRSCCRCARPRRCGRPAGPVSSNAALAVSSALARRSTTPRLDGPTMRMPVRAAISRSRASRASALGAGLGKAVGQHGRDLARRAGRIPRPPRSRPRSASRCRRAPAPRAAPRATARRARPAPSSRRAIDRIDAAGIARLPQIFQRPAGGLARVVRLPDDRDRVRREQRLAPARLRHCGASLGGFGVGGCADRSGGRTRARRCGSSASRSSRRRSSSRGCAACSIRPASRGCSRARP